MFLSWRNFASWWPKQIQCDSYKCFYEKKWPKVARFQGYQISRKLFCRCQISSTWIFAWILQCWTTHSPKPWRYFYKFPNPYLKHISARGLMQWFSLVAKFCYFLKFYLEINLEKLCVFSVKFCFSQQKIATFKKWRRRRRRRRKLKTLIWCSIGIQDSL